MGGEAVHDVSRSELLGPGRLRRLRTQHEGLAADFAAALSDLLRCPADVRLVGVDQLAYGQFIGSLAAPACFNVVKAEPLADRLLLDIEPAILYPMIDRLLGGHGDEPPPGRPLSDIELPLVARIVRLFLGQLQAAWKGPLDPDFEVLQTDSNPRLLRVLPADEMVVVVALQLTVGDLQGMVRLCLPCRAMQRMGEGYRQGSSNSDGQALVEVTVALATTPIAAHELASLRVGDVIATETAVGSPVVVSIDGQPKFRGEPGVCQGRKAVRLTEAIDDAPNVGPSK
jgi:flagellar motor switch protein FliM